MRSFRSTFLIRFYFTFLLALLIGVAASFNGQDAFAQKKKKDVNVEQAVKPKKSNIKTLPPSYGDQLNRLSEVLGSLHYLRTLCGANEGQKWRDEMQALVVAEAPTKKQKELMTARFNRGFRGYREIYRECTPAASQAAAEHLREGVKLSSEIPTRYGS